MLDHGAQFFTTRSPEFTAAVAEWTEAGVTSEWCRSFGSRTATPLPHQRWHEPAGQTPRCFT
ncbi:MAG: hypothetical protein R2710_01900 [Acidimicrobiales bacterium]